MYTLKQACQILNLTEHTIRYYTDIGIVEVKRDKSNSIVYNSDAKDYKEVENKWLNTKLNIKREDLEDGSKRYETTLVKNGVLYHLFGKIDENEFTEIVARMRF